MKFYESLIFTFLLYKSQNLGLYFCTDNIFASHHSFLFFLKIPFYCLIQNTSLMAMPQCLFESKHSYSSLQNIFLLSLEFQIDMFFSLYCLLMFIALEISSQSQYSIFKFSYTYELFVPRDCFYYDFRCFIRTYQSITKVFV